MKTPFRLRILLPALACIAFGAGCSLPFVDKPATDAPVTTSMRQPSPPQAPREEPVIPAEAAKVPRPY